MEFFASFYVKFLSFTSYMYTRKGQGKVTQSQQSLFKDSLFSLFLLLFLRYVYQIPLYFHSLSHYVVIGTFVDAYIGKFHPN